MLNRFCFLCKVLMVRSSLWWTTWATAFFRSRGLVAAACLGPFLLQQSVAAGDEAVPVVSAGTSNGIGRAVAVVVLPEQAEPVAQYAAEEFVWHVEQATGVKLPVANEASVPANAAHRIYLGSTRAAAEAGINVRTLPAEAFRLRTRGGDLIIAAQVMNNPRAASAERAAALDRLIACRRRVESLGIANLDRLAQIETESWKAVPGFAAPDTTSK